MTTPESSPAEEFEARVQIALGMSVEDLRALGEQEERLRQERIKAAGYCCEAGAVAHPGSCLWHDR